MDRDEYLERIGDAGPRAPAAATLARLHRAHMLSVPFENLDIHLGHRIELSRPSLYDKIVRRRRGGFCYELNGLFGWLLEALGFRVTTLSARVFSGSEPGPDFDHMLLLVELEERWIADVGFGDSFLEPLRLDAGGESLQQGIAYRLTASGVGTVLEQRQEGEWRPQYVFALTPRRLDEFAPMCHFQQTSPESHFTRKSVCSLATAAGRVTLSNDRLITTEAGRRQERRVAGEAEYRSLLESRFGIELGPGERVDKLLEPRPPATG